MDRQILETLEDPYDEKDYLVKTISPEFTCLCPDKRDQPDFATITLLYVPRDLLIELKSLKYYYVNYRDKEIYHEEATNMILEDLVETIDPRFMRVKSDWNIRGGITTIVETEYSAEDWNKQISDLEIKGSMNTASQGKN